MHSRRGFLKRTLGACWIGATVLEQSVFRAAAARAQSTTADPTLFDIEKVADGVYVAVARAQALINCNAVIFVNASDVLIVDSHSKPSAVASVVAQIGKEITTKPIRYIVNSHFHLDHTQGMAAYKRVAPHADVLSSNATRHLLAESGEERMKASVDQARISLDDYKKKIETAKSTAVKAYYQDMVSQTAGYIREMEGYQPELPNITFDGGMVIHDAAHELHLAFCGRGHTAGDIVLVCPQKRVVATADLLHGFLPTMVDGYPEEWPATLHNLAKFDFEHVLPGHGTVQHTRHRLYQMASYIAEVTEKVLDGKRNGRTPEQLVKEITPPTLTSLKSESYGDFVGDQLLKYMASAPGTTPADVLADGVRGNVQDTFRRLG